ncbi:MAG TPA: double zinc ribbon domain-containing protein [Gemmatimonadales bacterium]|nr:double zinc ribbon domain-containing protein [Gemmatimonadales bacterium]
MPSTAARALAHLLLPAECLLCRALLSFSDADRLVCRVCRHRWRPVTRPWCERCGQPEPLFGACRICAEWPAAFTRARSAVWLDEGPRHAVHALKYGGLPRIADDLAEAMAALRPPADEASVLVPIPLGARRLAARGYNQSERLGRALARAWERPLAADFLTRVRETATQTALTPAARLANVAGAFRARRSLPERFTAVLVDDVFTTGATLAAAAEALAAAGARRIAAVTFGRAAVPDFT